MRLGAPDTSNATLTAPDTPNATLTVPDTSNATLTASDTTNATLSAPDPTGEKFDRVAQGTLDPESASQLLDELFKSQDYLTVLKKYPEAQQYIDGLYKIICELPTGAPMRGQCFQALRKAGGERRLLPTGYHVTFALKKQDALPKAGGGFSEVWKAKCPKGTTYALKILRVTQENDFSEIQKNFCKEVLVSKHVRNENVMTIEGVQMADGITLCIVSKWMELGNMCAYLEKKKDADRAELLLGVTRGLEYLHSIDIIHGDLKGANVLIDLDGSPRLTDFGLSSTARVISSFNDSTPNRRGSTRWKAPELFEFPIKPKGLEAVAFVRPTKKSDVYSLAMVAIEIFTGKIPFYPYPEESVIVLLSRDGRPDRPTHGEFTSKMWTLVKKCWDKNSGRRPEIVEVLRTLESRGENNHYTLFAFLGSRINLPLGERLDTNHQG